MISMLLALLTTLIMGFVKKANPIEGASALVKQVVVVAIAALVNLIRIKSGYDVPGDMQEYVIATIMTAIESLGFYNLYAANAKAGAVSDNRKA